MIGAEIVRKMPIKALVAFGALVTAALAGVWPMEEAEAQSRSFERLPDGRIFIEIFGQQLALPASEPGGISFYTYQASEKRYGKPRFSLLEALADPEKARSTFDEEQRWVNVRIITGGMSDPPILERFARGTVPLSTAADPMGILIHRLPPQTSARGTLPAHWPPETQRADEDGYFVRPGVTGPNQTRPADTGYRLPASKRLFQASDDMVVICTHVGAPTRKCRQGLRTKDGRISISWSWFERGPELPPEMARFAFAKSEWRSFDLKLRQLADDLLLNQPAGVME